jgi:hypothetical protein
MKKTLFLLLLLCNIVCLGQAKKLDTAGLANATRIPSITNPKQNDSVSSFTQSQVDTINQIKVRYTKFAYAYRINLYNWQLTSSKYIFMVVAIIVLIGLYLSYLQFKASTKHITSTLNKQEVTKSDDQLSANKFEISKDGIKIDSAVIGLIILAISIVFFFLYLKFVFPINGNL